MLGVIKTDPKALTDDFEMIIRLRNSEGQTEDSVAKLSQMVYTETNRFFVR
jgi:hypothetical protein